MTHHPRTRARHRRRASMAVSFLSGAMTAATVLAALAAMLAK